MAQNVNTATTGLTVDEMVKRIKELETKNAALESANKMTLTVKLAKHGMGAISLNGMQRFPLSLHPAQWPELFVAGPAKIRQFMTDNADEIRCYGVAAEVAIKVTGLKSAPEKTDATRKAWETAWETGYAQAKADSKIIPSSPKYRPVADILAAWPS